MQVYSRVDEMISGMGKLFEEQLVILSLTDYRVHVIIALVVVLITPVVLFLISKFKPEARKKIESKMKAVKEFVAPGEGPRFRKRDRLAFMGRKVYRNAKAVGSFIRGGQVSLERKLALTVRYVTLHRSTG